MNCEIHLTFSLELEPKVQKAAEDIGWKFSKILNDPVLGDKPYCYLTTYAADAPHALASIRRARDVLFRSHNIAPIREKVEVIIYDWRLKP